MKPQSITQNSLIPRTLCAGLLVSLLAGCSTDSLSDQGLQDPKPSSIVQAQSTQDGIPVFSGQIHAPGDLKPVSAKLINSQGRVLAWQALNNTATYSCAVTGPSPLPKEQPPAGLTAGEYRAVIELSDGTRLYADQREDRFFCQVDEFTTIVSLYRDRHPGTSKEQAERALKTYLNLAADDDLRDALYRDTSFSEEEFLKKAQAYGNFGAFLSVQADSMAGAPTSEFRDPSLLGLGSYVGIDESGREQTNSADPDLTTALETARSQGLNQAVYAWEPPAQCPAAATISAVGLTLQDISGADPGSSIKDEIAQATKNGQIKVSVKFVSGLVSFVPYVGKVAAKIIDIASDQAWGEGTLKVVAMLDEAIRAQNQRFNQKFLIAEDTATLNQYLNSLVSYKVSLKNKAQKLSNPIRTLDELPASKGYPDADELSYDLSEIRSVGGPAKSMAQELVTKVLSPQAEASGISPQLKDSVITAYNKLLMRQIEVAPNPKFDGYSFRTNALTEMSHKLVYLCAQLLGQAAWLHINELNYETNHTLLSRYPIQETNSSWDLISGNGHYFDSCGGQGLAYQRRLFLQRAIPYISSSEVAIDPEHQIVWSLQSSARSLDEIVHHHPLAGFPLSQNVLDFDCVRPFTKDYALDNEEFSEKLHWRIPGIHEIAWLPKNLRAAGFQSLVNGTQNFLVWNPDKKTTFHRSAKLVMKDYLDIVGLNGTQVPELRLDPLKTQFNILRICDFKSLTQSMKPWNHQIPGLESSASIFESNLPLAAGLEPDRILVSVATVKHPLHQGKENRYPEQVQVLSALGVWNWSDGTYVVADLSGRVAWASSDPIGATVYNTASYLPGIEQTSNEWVSPYAAPIEFGQPSSNEVEFTATYGHKTENIKLAASANASLGIPAFPRSLAITPHSISIKRLPSRVLSLHAGLSYSNRRQQDVSDKVEWSLWQVDDNNQEQPLPEDVAKISQGDITFTAASGLGKRNIRIKARYQNFQDASDISINL